MSADALRVQVEAYLEHLVVERRLSAHTTENYRRDLVALLEWMDAGGIADFADIDGERLRGFIAGEHRRGLSPKSLQRRLSALRSFFRYLLKRGRLATDVAACARAVVHHDGLAQLSRQRLADDAGQDVGGAACGEGHDDGDGLGGVSLGQGGRTAEQTSAQNDGRSDGTQGEAAGGVGMWHGGLLQRSWWTKIAFGEPRPNRHSV